MNVERVLVAKSGVRHLATTSLEVLDSRVSSREIDLRRKPVRTDIVFCSIIQMMALLGVRRQAFIFSLVDYKKGVDSPTWVGVAAEGLLRSIVTIRNKDAAETRQAPPQLCVEERTVRAWDLSMWIQSNPASWSSLIHLSMQQGV